jgi:cell division protease FtsH
MVTKYGTTERLGAVKLGSDSNEPFLGMQAGMGSGHGDYSDAIAAAIDEEVAALINTAHQEAFDVLEKNRDVLDELVRQLFEKETLDKEQVARIFEALRRWPKRPAWTGSNTRVPSTVPPVDPPAPASRPTGVNGSQPLPAPGVGVPVQGSQPPMGPGHQPGQQPWQGPWGQQPPQQG